MTEILNDQPIINNQIQMNAAAMNAAAILANQQASTTVSGFASNNINLETLLNLNRAAVNLNMGLHNHAGAPNSTNGNSTAGGLQPSPLGGHNSSPISHQLLSPSPAVNVANLPNLVSPANTTAFAIPNLAQAQVQAQVQAQAQAQAQAAHTQVQQQAAQIQAQMQSQVINQNLTQNLNTAQLLAAITSQNQSKDQSKSVSVASLLQTAQSQNHVSIAQDASQAKIGQNLTSPSSKMIKKESLKSPETNQSSGLRKRRSSSDLSASSSSGFDSKNQTPQNSSPETINEAKRLKLIKTIQQNQQKLVDLQNTTSTNNVIQQQTSAAQMLLQANQQLQEQQQQNENNQLSNSPTAGQSGNGSSDNQQTPKQQPIMTNDEINALIANQVYAQAKAQVEAEQAQSMNLPLNSNQDEEEDVDIMSEDNVSKKSIAINDSHGKSTTWRPW